MKKTNKMKIGSKLNCIALLTPDVTYKKIKPFLDEIEEIISNEPEEDEDKSTNESEETTRRFLSVDEAIGLLPDKEENVL